MKNYGFKLNIFWISILSFMSLNLKAQVNPFVYYTFDDPNSINLPWNSSNAGLDDILSSCTSCTAAIGNPIGNPFANPVSVVGKCLEYSSPSESYLTCPSLIPFPSFLQNSFTVELLLKIDAGIASQRRINIFNIGTAGSPTVGSAVMVLYPKPQFQFTKTNSSPLPISSLTINLDGIGRKSLEFYMDGNWHHFVFVYRGIAGSGTGNSGRMEMWVDGELPTGFTNDLASTDPITSTTSKIFFSNNSILYDKLVGALDELAFYDDMIPAEEIVQHFNDFSSNQHYKYKLSTTIPIPQPVSSNHLDPLEFPLGADVGFYPGESAKLKSEGVEHSAIGQLQSYPLPRFKTGHTMLPNLNYMQSRYMGGQKRIGVVDPVSMSTQIQAELATNWNYYFNLAENLSSDNGLTQTDVNGGYSPNFGLNTTYPGSWISCIKGTGPFQVPSGTKTAVLMYRAQLNPSTALQTGLSTLTVPAVKYQGFDTNTGDVESPNYLKGPSNAYYVSSTGAALFGGSVATSKTWNPAAPSSDYFVDGNAMKQCILNIQRELSTTSVNIDMIAENNEYTTKYSNTILQNDNDVIAAAGGLYNEFQSLKKKELDNYYRDLILSAPGLGNTNYINYAVDGNERFRWLYTSMRETQRFDLGSTNPNIPDHPWSTPDFYPENPSNWRLETAGNIHGFNWLNTCRKTELDALYNDNLYAPFIGAGWYRNDNYTLRPGQWLGLLKAASMMGAEFFNTGYFNIDSYNANLTPNNPAGYIWQISTPVYAQAIMSRVEGFLRNGYLMTGNIPIDLDVPAIMGYSLNAGYSNYLSLVRKDNSTAKYLINGCIQRYSNQPTGAAIEANAEIDIPGGPLNLKFPIRIQGSTYVLDNTQAPAVFYQLDGWHQWEHPEYWSPNFHLEAELFDNTIATNVISTEDLSGQQITNFDYSQFVSAVSGNTQQFDYAFHPRSNQDYYVLVRARSKTGSTTANIELFSGQINGSPISVQSNAIGCIDETSWKWNS